MVIRGLVTSSLTQINGFVDGVLCQIMQDWPILLFDAVKIICTNSLPD
jgi:hypothetical protein